MTKAKEKHYRVESKLYGRWAKCEYVFATREQAEQFGQDQQINGEVGDYRVLETTKPVNLPEYIADPSI